MFNNPPPTLHTLPKPPPILCKLAANIKMVVVWEKLDGIGEATSQTSRRGASYEFLFRNTF